MLASFLLVIASTLGCNSPSGPGDSSTLAFGSATPGNIGVGEVKQFALDARAGQVFAVYVQAAGGAVTLTLQNSAAQVVSSDVAPAGDTATMLHGVATVNLADQRYTVLISVPARSNGGDFTLHPTLVNLAPEHVPQSVALGDVVTGERIDHAFDRDEFFFDVPVAQHATLYLHSDSPDHCHLGVDIVRVGGTTPVFNQFVCPPGGSASLDMGAAGQFALDAGRYVIQFGGELGSAYTFQIRPAP
jgi:hypothetical protein